MSRNLDLMLAAASQEEENKDAIVALEKAAAELRSAKEALESTKAELVSAKDDLQNAKTELNKTYQKLVDAKNALDAAVQSTDNIVGGITNAIVKAEQSTVPVGVKESDMTKIEGKFSAFETKIKGIARQSLNDHIQEFQHQRQNAYNQYKEWDGIWFGRYSQWIFIPFYFMGFGIVVLIIVMAFVNTR